MLISPKYLSGFQRARHSPGALANWDSSVGSLRRIAAGLVKIGNLAAVPLKPLGIRSELLQTSLIQPPKVSPERADLAGRFYKSFDNRAASDFYFKYLAQNFSQAVLDNHPDSLILDEREIFRKCSLLVRMIRQRVTDCRSRPEYMFKVFRSIGQGFEPPDPLWFLEFKKAYQENVFKNKAEHRDRLLFQLILGDSLVDIGCGWGGDIVYIQNKHPDVIKRAAGIDTINPAAVNPVIRYFQLDFSVPGTVLEEQYDSGMVLYVLHHVGKKPEEIKSFLAGVKTAVSRRLLVLEDICLTDKDLSLRLPGLERMSGLIRQQEQLAEFIQLDEQSRFDFTVISDVFSNGLYRGVNEINFPFGFHSISEWVGIFGDNGFRINQVQLLGFPPGNFHRACHALFVLDL